MHEVQDILSQAGAEFLGNHTLSPVQTKAFRAIQHCRTSKLGAHIDTCDECGFEKISYNSCRNRHCPKCQTLAKEQWIEKQNQYLLNTPYFHVVFTLPEELNSLMLNNQKIAYGLFFKAVSETLLELCVDKKHLGATPGITAVLHTWGQNLMFHPHIHCIVTGGGLTKELKWQPSRKKFFLSVKVLSRKFRGKFLALLMQENLAPNPILHQKEWVVYCKPPFKSPTKVIEYLGRYTHRVAISNHRIMDLHDGKVTFSWRDYHDGKKKAMIVSASEFIRRFLLHILPISNSFFPLITVCAEQPLISQTFFNSPRPCVLDKLARNNLFCFSSNNGSIVFMCSSTLSHPFFRYDYYTLFPNILYVIFKQFLNQGETDHGLQAGRRGADGLRDYRDYGYLPS